MVNDQGNLIACTFDPTLNTLAFSKWTTNGIYESVATISNDSGEDEIWVCVRRATITVDGGEEGGEGGEGGEGEPEPEDPDPSETVQQFSTALAASQWADEFYIHDGYNLTDNCTVTISGGCFGAVVYQYLAYGYIHPGIFDGAGSSLYVPLSEALDDLWWGSYVKVGGDGATSAWAIQWQGGINDIGEGATKYITPWHGDYSCIVIQNLTSVTQEYVINLQMGEFVA
jgi:hypothetical protein